MIKLALIAGKFLKRVIVGAIVDTAKVSVIAPAKAVYEEVKHIAVENVDSEDGGQGKPDFVRAISTVAAIGFGAAYVFGYITLEELKHLATIILSLLF